jgi:glycosyltransferase involved in cell wall biosynthesis
MGDKVRVLQLVNGELYAGAERVQEMLLRLLDRRRFRPVCVALMDGAFVRRAHEQKLPVDVVPMWERWDLTVVARLIRYIREHQIDIVHTHTVRTNLVGRLAARLSGVPVITHVHSSPLHEWENPLKSRLNWRVERLTRRWTDRFICVSSYLRDQLLSEGVPAERIAAISNGLEPEWFCCSDHSGARQEKMRLCRRLGVSRDARLVAMVAWFRPLKGVETFLEALAQLKGGAARSDEEVVGLLVGGFASKRYRRRVDEQVCRLGLTKKVYPLGFQGAEGVRGILKVCDVAVLPSHRPEGLPISLVEAMALGKPVIATAVGGIPEVVRDGETGLLISPGDGQALTRALLRILKDPKLALRLGTTAREFVWANHQAERMVRQIERVYTDVLMP